MKRCPKCNTDYFDNMIEFCLEDGVRLNLLSTTEREIGTVTHTASRNPATAKTVDLPFSAPISPFKQESPDAASPTISVGKKIETKVKTKSIETLAIAPIVVSLLHNWIQWLYVSNKNFDSIGAFLISPNFAVWFILLILGAVLGLLALKFCEKKGFAYVSLVVLAINLLLLLVPKR